MYTSYINLSYTLMSYHTSVLFNTTSLYKEFLTKLFIDVVLTDPYVYLLCLRTYHGVLINKF